MIESDLQHDSGDDIIEPVLRALGQAGKVGPGVQQHKLLQGRQSAEEVVDQGYEEAKALEAQHDQPQRQPVASPLGVFQGMETQCTILSQHGRETWHTSYESMAWKDKT